MTDTATRPDTITLPHLVLRGDLDFATLSASAEYRNDVLERLFIAEGHSFAELPPAYLAGGPLARWCWLVLAANGITPEYREDGTPYQLVHYGIDLGFASTAVRAWTFFLA